MLGFATAVPFQKVKVSAAVGLEARDIFVTVRDDLPFVVEVLVPVRFTIPIAIVQTSDLVPTDHVNLIAYDFQTERLEQAGGESLPAEAIEAVVDPRHQPHIPMQS